MSEKIRQNGRFVWVGDQSWSFPYEAATQCKALCDSAYSLGVADERARWEKKSEPAPAWQPPTKAETVRHYRSWKASGGVEGRYGRDWRVHFCMFGQHPDMALESDDALALQMALERSR